MFKGLKLKPASITKRDISICRAILKALNLPKEKYELITSDEYAEGMTIEVHDTHHSFSEHTIAFMKVHGRKLLFEKVCWIYNIKNESKNHDYGWEANPNGLEDSWAHIRGVIEDGYGCSFSSGFEALKGWQQRLNL